MGKAHSPRHGCGNTVIAVPGQETAHAAAGQAQGCNGSNVQNLEHWRFVDLCEKGGCRETAEYAAEPGVSAPERRDPVEGQRIFAQCLPLDNDRVVELGANQSGNGHRRQEYPHGNGNSTALEVGLAEKKSQRQSDAHHQAVTPQHQGTEMEVGMHAIPCSQDFTGCWVPRTAKRWLQT